MKTAQRDSAALLEIEGRLVDVGDAAAGVDAGTTASPGCDETDDMDQEPEADALVAVDPEEDQEARDEQGHDDGDDADDGRDVLRHGVLEPRDQDADARKEEGEDEKPERDVVRCQIEVDVHEG